MTPSGPMRRLRAWLADHPTVPVFAFVLLCHVVRYVDRVPLDYYPGGDGYYIYMLARSMAFDGDIELTNDYAICGDPWSIGKDFGTGHPANPWFIGPAVIWAPVLAVLRHLIPLGPSASEAWVQGCRGPTVYALGFLAPLFTMLTVWFGYRIALRFVSRNVSLVAAMVVAFGSLLVTFGPLWWNYSHVWAAASLTAAILCYVRTTERVESVGRWIATGAAIGLASLMRPHHVFWLLAPALLTVVEMVREARARRWPVASALRGLAALAAFAVVFYVRLGSYDYLYGSPWPPVLRSVYIQPAHAHPLLVLFSGRAGLLTYSPPMWLAVIGFALSLRIGAARIVLLPIASAFLFDFWLCSSPLEWTGGATVGPRLLTSFCGLFVVYSALTLSRLHAFATRTPERSARLLALGWLAPILLLSWRLTDGDPPHEAPSIYGRAVRGALDEIYGVVGNPMTFPAPVVFGLRYRTEPSHFDRVADYGLFLHDFERGRLIGEDRISFARPQATVLMLEGLEEIEGGRRLHAGRPGRFIYPLAWPYVSSVGLHLMTPPGRDGCRIRVENAQFVHRDRTASISLARDQVSIVVPVPRGMFDSGINETVLRSNCGLDLLVWRWIDDSDAGDTSPLPHYEDDPRFR